uniref:Ankyrin repeat protein n=1 Tax=Pithovirus LCPAC304 TaxID=2506594 RepID=A0A481Z8C7_9VIRU|nr:MAG: ankyrin repeat protein [Pithovirus LCPAC304]
MEDPLTALTIKELRAIARQYQVKGRSKPTTKTDLVAFLRKNLTIDQIKKSVGGKKPTAKTRKTELFDLPIEVIWKTLFNLLPKDILQFCATHHRANNIICQNDDFWAQKIQRDFEGMYETSSIPIGTRFETYKEYWDNARERFSSCVLEGHTECVKSLLRLGVDPNSEIAWKYTALRVASYKGYADIVRLLLEHGADPNIRDLFGFTALMIAVSFEHADIVPLLLEHGADPNIRNDGTTALIMASDQGDTDIVVILLEHDADPNIRNKNGNTALDLASRAGHADIVRILS